MAFYNALETNDSVVQDWGNETFREMVRDFVKIVKKLAIDWTMRENVYAQLRVLVKRILRKCGHPSNKQGKETQAVPMQALWLSSGWTSEGG